MRKILSILFVLAVVCTGCEGPEGLPGRDGLDGRDGVDGEDGLVATVFEIDQVNFTPENNFGINFQFPATLFDSDVLYVYRLEAVDNGKAVWEPLPTATIYFDDNQDGINDGFLQYRFNFTIDDVDILIESDNSVALGEEFVTNQVFRIVIVPGAFGSVKSSTNPSFKKLIETYTIKEKDIIKISL